jgi:hypothetical protein
VASDNPTDARLRERALELATGYTLHSDDDAVAVAQRFYEFMKGDEKKSAAVQQAEAYEVRQ